MKNSRIISLVLAIVLTVSAVSFLAVTSTAYSADGFTYEVSNGKATIKKYTGSAANLTIPSTLGGYPVTAIGNGAFFDCSSLINVVIPNGVTSIGRSAFDHCMSLKSIVIPEGVSIIDQTTFWDCWSLTSVTLPNSLKAIGEGAFDSCKSLKNINIPKGVTSIGGSAFWCCTSLRSITLWETVSSIGEGAFAGCTSLVIFGVPGSCAESYAKEMKLPFRKIGDSGPRFSDVRESDWFYSAVEFAIDNGLFNGVDLNRFAPNMAMNRAMLVTVLYRMEGMPSMVSVKNNFSDVKYGKYYYAVLWASQKGVVNGVSANSFAPNDNITREQMATILYRYSAYKNKDVSAVANLAKYPDAGKVSSYAMDALSWANAEGLINGTDIGGVAHLDPKGKATRAQVATILMRYAKI